MKCIIILAISCIVAWTAAAMYWNSQYAGGCWCGPFANWVPADGLVHAADAAKFEHTIYFACGPAASPPQTNALPNECVADDLRGGATLFFPYFVAARTTRMAEQPGTFFAIFALRVAVLAGAPLVLAAALGVQRVVVARKKLVSPAAAGAELEGPNPLPWTNPLFQPLPPML